MKAVWNDQIIAEADKDDLVYIEGNWYFPPSSIKKEYFEPTNQHSVCYWKGLASYYNIDVGGKFNSGAAWYYSKPTRLSKIIVKKDFANYVAFWQGVKVET